MTSEEIYYTIALTRMTGFNQQMALQLYQTLGSGKAVYDHRHDLGDVMPAAAPRLRAAMKNWDDALHRAAAEMEFVTKNNIRVLTLGDDDYPRRLSECPDAPLLLYYKGSADLNQRYVLNIVGTRHCTTYGQDLIRRFIADLRKQCPQVLVVSGLAYGVDVCAHRHALENGYETVGVLAHGLDQVYPNAHRDIARQMLTKGGLLTEYMSQTEALPNNFRQRNRIVAGMSDATIVVESAYKGGALITARFAAEQGKDIYAIPGNINSQFSIGCNLLIRDGAYPLIVIDDLVRCLGKDPVSVTGESAALGDDERIIFDAVQRYNGASPDRISEDTGVPTSSVNALVTIMEIKGFLRTYAGKIYIAE